MLCIIIDYFVAEENGCTAGTEQLAPQLAGGCWHPDNQRVVGTTVLRARVCQRQGIAPHSLEAVPAATPYATRAHLPTMLPGFLWVPVWTDPYSASLEIRLWVSR